MTLASVKDETQPLNISDNNVKYYLVNKHGFVFPGTQKYSIFTHTLKYETVKGHVLVYINVLKINERLIY